MARPSIKLADSLEALKALQDSGMVAIQSKDLSRLHRERLVDNGFLQEVMQGWYIPSRPNEPEGESTSWYSAFWPFVASYLTHRFADEWCLSPEQSLSLHAGNWTVPQQLFVRSPKGSNKITPLPHNTSLFDARYIMPDPKEVEIHNGLRLYSVASALIACSPKYFTQNPTDLRASLAMISDASEVLSFLLAGGHSVIAGRIAGAFRNIGRDIIADDIIKTMKAAGFSVRESDPFEEKLIMTFSTRERSPYVNRMKLLWRQMRESVIDVFPDAPGISKNKDAYLKHVEEIYVTDAYHSLSIEGYRVSPELIDRVRSGSWDPDEDENDSKHKNALAARGYWQAFQHVKLSVEKTLSGDNAGEVVRQDHSSWYRELFGPSIAAGIFPAKNLAGYRSSRVFIRGSMHVPPGHEALRDLMPAFYDLLGNETSAAARIVLGHFFFVHIHPYMDGNGRMGRFLMNVMAASGGYPWIIVPVEKRRDYMTALEEASVNQNIEPLAKFIAGLVEEV